MYLRIRSLTVLTKITFWGSGINYATSKRTGGRHSEITREEESRGIWTHKREDAAGSPDVG